MASHGDFSAPPPNLFSCSCWTEGDIWDDILKQMQRVHYGRPPGSVAIFPLSAHHSSEVPRKVTKSLASSPAQSASGRLSRYIPAHAHTVTHTIWPRHIMRVINVSVKRVIDRWRGELSGSSIHNQEKMETRVSRPRRQKHTIYIMMRRWQCQSSYLTWPSHPNETPDEIVWIFM